MARSNKIRFAGCLLIVISIVVLSGCASYKARQAYEEAERYSAEENFVEALEKYLEATELEPGSKKYKLKLLSSRTRAAVTHVAKARKYREAGKVSEALQEYRLAKKYDPSLEVAHQEEQEVVNLLTATDLAEEGASFYAKRNLVLAKKAVNRALKLDPDNARALAIKDLLDRDLSKVLMEGVELDVASDEPITLSFKDANVKEVFGILSELSGINFIFDEEIRSQSISVLLEKASFAQAMELIMQMNGLEKKVLNSKTIIIYPESREKSKQYDDQIIQTFYLSHIDAKKAVNLLRTMLQLRKIYVHEERNALVVRDKPEVIRLAEQILEAADRENSEVILELELVSVSDTDALDIGTKLSAYSAGAGFSKTETSPSLVAKALPSADGADLSNLVQSLNGLETFYTIPSAVFNLAKTLTSTEILANPKIRVRNKEKAKVHVGSREPVVTTTTTNSTSTTNIQYVDVGIKLDVEPNIQLNNTVETKLKLEVSQVTDRVEVGPEDAKTTALTISTTNAETVLTLQDGVQAIIGGLFEESEVKQRDTIPFLGDIPILGALFTNFSNDDNKREILLSITPHIIRQVEVPNVDEATIWSGGEDNLKDGPNFGAFAQPLKSDLEVTRPLAAPAVTPVSAQKSEVSDEIVAEPVPGPVTEQENPAEVESVEPGAPEPEAEEEPLPGSTPEEAPSDEVAAAEEVPAGETVPVEVIAPEEELGAPIVLPMPAKQPAKVSFKSPEAVAVEKEFSVSVEVNAIENLYSAPLFVYYDPAVLELLSIQEGDFLKQGGETTIFSSSPNRSTGKVIIGYKQGTGGKGVSGEGTLFKLVFKPVATGQATIEASRINFRNPDGVRLDVNSEAATIEIR